jgi:hypothetical protein
MHCRTPKVFGNGEEAQWTVRPDSHLQIKMVEVQGFGNSWVARNLCQHASNYYIETGRSPFKERSEFGNTWISTDYAPIFSRHLSHKTKVWKVGGLADWRPKGGGGPHMPCSLGGTGPNNLNQLRWKNNQIYPNDNTNERMLLFGDT